MWASFSVLLGRKEWEQGDSSGMLLPSQESGHSTEISQHRMKEPLQQVSYHCCGCWHILEHSCCSCCTLFYHLEAGQEQQLNKTPKPSLPTLLITPRRIKADPVPTSGHWPWVWFSVNIMLVMTNTLFSSWACKARRKFKSDNTMQ